MNVHRHDRSAIRCVVGFVLAYERSMHALSFIRVLTASFSDVIIDVAIMIVGALSEVFALFKFCDQPVFIVDRNDAFSLKFAIEEGPFVFNVDPNAIVLHE